MRSTSVGRSIDHGNGVFAMVGGRMAQVAHDPEPPRLFPAGGGFAYPVSRDFPRTCLEMLPASVSVEHDLNGDGKPDIAAKIRVTVEDRNGNGRYDIGDAVLLEPIHVHVIGTDGVRLIISEDTLLALCSVIPGKL